MCRVQSRMVRGLAAPLLYICGLSTAICAGHQAAEVGLVAGRGGGVACVGRGLGVCEHLGLTLHAHWLAAPAAKQRLRGQHPPAR